MCVFQEWIHWHECVSMEGLFQRGCDDVFTPCDVLQYRLKAGSHMNPPEDSQEAVVVFIDPNVILRVCMCVCDPQNWSFVQRWRPAFNNSYSQYGVNGHIHKKEKNVFATFKGVKTPFLMSQSVVVASPLSLEDLITSMMKLIAGFITQAGRGTWMWGSQLDTCRERRDGNRKKKLVHLRAFTVEETPSQWLGGWKTFPFLFVMQHIFDLCPARKRHWRKHWGRSHVFKSSALLETNWRSLSFFSSFFFKLRLVWEKDLNQAKNSDQQSYEVDTIKDCGTHRCRAWCWTAERPPRVVGLKLSQTQRNEWGSHIRKYRQSWQKKGVERNMH